MACEPVIGVDEAAEILGLHRNTVRDLASKGELPAFKLGRMWKFRASLLDEYLNAQLRSSSALRSPSEAR